MKINCMNAKKNTDAMSLVSKFDDILEQAESKETETYIESCKKLFENLSESTEIQEAQPVVGSAMGAYLNTLSRSAKR